MEVLMKVELVLGLTYFVLATLHVINVLAHISHQQPPL